MGNTGRFQREAPATPFEARWAWRGGALAGLYGQEGILLAGWVAHLLHGTLFGVVFAAILADPGLHRIRDWVWKSVVAGVVYGLVLAVVGAGIVMPIRLGAVGFATPPSIPFVSVPLLGWHVVYGVVLGAVFPLLDGL